MRFERAPSAERKIESLAASSEEFGERRQNEGFPVQLLTGRIDMLDPAFRELRGPWQSDRDERGVQEKERLFKTSLLQVNGSDVEKRLRNEGEQFELITALILEKFLSRRFVVLRSSPHDDIQNGVDTVLLDKETGKIVCAFDEVGDDKALLDEKEARSARTNLIKGGISLDYGFRKDKNGKFVPASVENLPLFHLAISSKDLREMEGCDLNADPTHREKIFFRDFLKIMMGQAAALQDAILEQMKGGGAALRGERSLVLWEIKERAENFEKTLEEVGDKEFGLSEPGRI